jgi:ribokinase
MSGRGFAEAVAPPPLPASVLAARPIYACDPNLGLPAVESAVRAAEAGCPVVAMDFASVPEVVRVSRILVTSREFIARQGVPGTPEAVARDLVRGGARTAIVTLGAEGGIVADREEGVFPFSAFRPGGIVDTTGAGDTFRAGLCYGLLYRLPLRDTVRFASAAAALHCRVWGGGSRVPLADVRRLAAE